MAHPWNTALFPSDYLGTDWQFFQRDVREHFKSPYLSRRRGRKKNTTFGHLPKKAQAPFCKSFLSAKIEGAGVKNLLPDTENCPSGRGERVDVAVCRSRAKFNIKEKDEEEGGRTERRLEGRCSEEFVRFLAPVRFHSVLMDGAGADVLKDCTVCCVPSPL